MPSQSANASNEKQYDALKEKGMSIEQAAKIANPPRRPSTAVRSSAQAPESRTREEPPPTRRPAARAAKPPPRTPDPRRTYKQMGTFTRGGLTFNVSQGGPAAGECFVLLHGFPETSAAWTDVASRLHARGYRTLAPDQRGYSLDARPRGVAAYRVEELAADVVALADDAGLDRFHLVGHDWGGIVAWYLAAHQPERLVSLSVLSTPHPRAFLDSLGRSAQALRSSYVLAWQMPRLPEWTMLLGGGWPLRTMLSRSGLDDATVERYVAAMRTPGVLTAALNWYRALRFSGAALGSLPAIRVPTLYVWSTRDGAMSRAAAERTARHVSGPYRFEVLKGVSHWIPEAEPEHTAALLDDHARSAM